MIHILVLFSFWFLLLYLASCRIKLLPSIFRNLQILFLHSWFTKTTNLCQRDFMYPPIQTYAYIVFCSYIFTFFYHLPYILNVKTCSTKRVSIFCIVVYVFHNLFWKYAVYCSNHVFEAFQGFFFCLPLIAKSCFVGEFANALLIWFEIWSVQAWYFAMSGDQRHATHLKNVYQLKQKLMIAIYSINILPWNKS